MKSLFVKMIPVAVFAAISCGNSPGSDKAASSTANQISAAANASQGRYGTFTFTSNGQQRKFTCYHKFFLMPLQTSSGNIDAIMLEDGGPSNAGFDFKINKQGTTEFKPGYANVAIPGLLFDFFDTSGVSYTGDGMTVNVTSLSADKLSGTFAGKFVKEKSQIKDNPSPDVPQMIEVTDGKFDLHL